MGRKRKPLPPKSVVVVDLAQRIDPTVANYDERMSRVSVDTGDLGDFVLDQVNAATAMFHGELALTEPTRAIFLKMCDIDRAVHSVRRGCDVLVRKEVPA